MKYGYHDGWLAEEDELGPVYEYTGAGAEGDQTFGGLFGKGNSAVLKHAEKGRTLHLFVAEGKVPGSDSKTHRYVGAFALDEQQPYVVRQGLGGDRKARKAIVFRLRPVGPVQRTEEDEIPPAPKTEAVPVAADVTTSKMVEPEQNKNPKGRRSATPATVAERREANLSDGLEAYLKAQLHEVGRFQITIKGRTSTLLTDLYDVTADVLYEAKGTSGREAVRMALGQLLDYSRFIHPEEGASTPRRAVLLPSLPDEDLQDLLAEHAVSIVYPGQDDGVFIGIPEAP